MVNGVTAVTVAMAASFDDSLERQDERWAKAEELMAAMKRLVRTGHTRPAQRAHGNERRLIFAEQNYGMDTDPQHACDQAIGTTRRQGHICTSFASVRLRNQHGLWSREKRVLKLLTEPNLAASWCSVSIRFENI